MSIRMVEHNRGYQRGQDEVKTVKCDDKSAIKISFDIKYKYMYVKKYYS